MTHEQIQHLIRQYRDRGVMTRREFCESRGVTPTTLDYYLRRYGSKRPVTRLARVEIAESREQGRYTLVLANGRRIECGEIDLAQLIRLAEEA